jgi:hypothetical protein
MGTGKVSEMSAQIGQKAPDFKMQGIFKGEIHDVNFPLLSDITNFEGSADRRNVPRGVETGKIHAGKSIAVAFVIILEAINGFIPAQNLEKKIDCSHLTLLSWRRVTVP